MEAQAPSWAFVLTLACLAAYLLNFFIPKRHRKINLPPGPKQWPIIGNLNLVSGPLTLHQSLHKLSQQYGPIMQLKFGSFPVVIGSSPEIAMQFLKTHDHVFACRPQTAAGKYLTYNFSNITFSDGAYWRQGRKVFLTELFSTKQLNSFEYIRTEEVHGFISCLYALARKPITLRECVYDVTFSIISRITLGRKYVNESKFVGSSSIVTVKEFEEMVAELFFLLGALNIGDWIPWLNFLDLQGYVRRMKALSERFSQFYNLVFSDHKTKMKDQGKEFVPECMVDLLLQMADDSNLDVKLTYDNVKALTQDLLAAGTDTATVTIEWAMCELVKQPYLIKQATEELDRVIGRERWVEEKDLSQLTFIDCIVKETMRKHPAAPLLVPRLALEDCNVAGYDIRKGTRIFINTWSIGRDESLWENSDEFIPERFKDKDIDVRGQNFEFLPFGSGRRTCPGYKLGVKMIWSVLANMLHGFSWKLPDNMTTRDLNMEESSGLTTPKKFPLVVVMEPRLPTHLYF